MFIFFPQTVWGEEDICASKPIKFYEIRGCEIPECNNKDFIEGLLDTADVRIGEVRDMQALSRGAERVQRLNFFKKVDIFCQPRGEGILVILEVTPVTRLREIIFTGNRFFYDSKLQDRISLQSKDPFEPDEPDTKDLLEQVKDTIKKLYIEHGFEGTDVEIEVIPVRAYDVDLKIKISEGSRRKITGVSVSLTSSKPFDSKYLKKGYYCPNVKVKDLKDWTGVKPGDPYTEKTVPDVVRRLSRHLRSIGFSGVKVHARVLDGKLEVEAQYDECYLIRFFVRDSESLGRTGYRPKTDVEFLDLLPFADSGVFDVTEASLGREEIQTFLENKGYLFAKVELDFRKPRGGQDQEGLSKRDKEEWIDPRVGGVISYFITLNRHVEIRKIRIFGNKKISSNEIEKVITTKEYDFFGEAGAVMPDQVFSDLERIEKLYRDNGYHNIGFQWAKGIEQRLREKVIDGKDVLYVYSMGKYAFRVRVFPHTSGVYLEIGIIEGEQSILKDVRIEGVSAISLKDAEEITGLRKGRPFSSSLVREGVSRLLRTLSNQGYLYADAKIACQGYDPDVNKEECNIETIRSHQVELLIQVNQGIRTKVGAVFVQGVRRTTYSTILRDFPKPQEYLDAQKLAEALRILKDMGIFSSVQVTHIGADEKPSRDRIALVINVREARSRFVDISGGIETLNRAGDVPGYISSHISTSIALQDRTNIGFGRALGLQIPDVLVSMEIRYTDMNFLGRAKRLYLPFKYGLSATAWDRYAAFTPTYVDPRFFIKGLSFRITPFAIYDRATRQKLDIIQFGSEFSVSKEIVKQLYGALSYEVAEVKTKDADSMTSFSPFRLENKVINTMTYDQLDHPINPLYGGFMQTSLAYINALVGDDLRNYLKFEVTGKMFLTARRLLTLAIMARYGDSKSFQTGGKLPPEERFTLGGNKGVRGFSDDGISQYLSNGDLRLIKDDKGLWKKPYGGDTLIAGSVELRFPIIRKLNIHGCLFYDFGGLAEGLSKFNTKSFRSSVGFGIRYLFGATIPFRLDYGVILDRRCKEVDTNTGQCILKEEVGNIHFGVLYTF